jgi:DNA-binding HxlR family transcriptional regulator
MNANLKTKIIARALHKLGMANTSILQDRVELSQSTVNRCLREMHVNREAGYQFEGSRTGVGRRCWYLTEKGKELL